MSETQTAIEELIEGLQTQSLRERDRNRLPPINAALRHPALLAELKQAAADAELRRMVETIPDEWFLQRWDYQEEGDTRWFVFDGSGMACVREISVESRRGDGPTPDAALKAALDAAGGE